MTKAADFWSLIPQDITRVAVIGAGAMGGGIAAQFANAGVEVLLYDMKGDGDDPVAPARAGIERQVKIKGFMGTSGPTRVTPLNTEDHLDRLAEVQWIVEVVVERLEVKRALYARIDALYRPGTIISSNTSTLLHAQLVEGRSPAFRRDFIITHFFNPPRLMPLLEIVSTNETDPSTLARAHAGARALLGKVVIDCRDTSGFIANRIGCFWMAAAATLARDAGLTVEEADAVHQAFGVPKTGVFGLFDLIGIDLVPQVWRSLVTLLPQDDRFQRYDIASQPLFQQLVADGRFGRKSGGGFYRKGAAGMEATDLTSGDWRAQQRADVPGGGRDLGTLLADDSRFGRYARRLLAEVIGYAAAHAPAIAPNPADVDTALRLGYAWRKGPFQIADDWGAANVAAELVEAGLPVPDLLDAAVKAGGFYQKGRFVTGSFDAADTRLSVARLRAEGRVILGNDAATLLDSGDGVGIFAIHTKMNSFHPQVLDLLEETLPLLGDRLTALVIGNDDPRAFSVGADLRFILSMIDAGSESGAGGDLTSYIDRGQRLFLGLRYAPVPVVAAAHGFALGGGLEVALHCDRIVAHAELHAALPEVLVGLIPAWGGCTTLLARGISAGLAPEEAGRRAITTILGGAQSGSAEEALESGLLGPDDRLVMDREALLATARNLALSMVADYTPPATLSLPLASTLDLATLAEGRQGYDLRLMAALTEVMSGPAPRSDRENMAEERRVLFDLIAQPETRARMDHMLQTGKPLKN